MNVEQTLNDTAGWKASYQVSQKFASGTLSTAKYSEKTDNFLRMNEKLEEVGSLYPQSCYFGKMPRDGADPFDKRVVTQLDDIDFEEDSDLEEDKNLKRMPKTILNEENFKENVTVETTRVALENHYWLKNNVLSKLGRMAPNLTMLSLRRMKNITNPVFAEIFSNLKQLTHIDLIDCHGLLTTACNLMIDNNSDLEYVQLSGCNLGVDNTVLANIAKLENLNFLDLSYCKNFDDGGIKAFAGKTYPLETLIINGATGVSGEGLKNWIKSFTADL